MKSTITPLLVSLLCLSGCATGPHMAPHAALQAESDGKTMAPSAALLQQSRDDALRQDIAAKQKRIREIDAQEQQAKAASTPNQ